MLFKTGAIYSIWYQNYKTNIKSYAFILYAAPGSKVHALNLGAKQLGVIERAKLIRGIVTLMKVPGSNKYPGSTLYRVFKTYYRTETFRCYRTYHHQYITQSALINYGLNKQEDFDDIELRFMNKELYEKAKKDIIVKGLNLFSGRGVKLNQLKDSLTFAKKDLPAGETPTVDAVEKTTPDDDFGYF